MLYLRNINDERQVLKFRWFIIGISDKHSHGLNNLKATRKQIVSHKLKQLYQLLCPFS